MYIINVTARSVRQTTNPLYCLLRQEYRLVSLIIPSRGVLIGVLMITAFTMPWLRYERSASADEHEVLTLQGIPALQSNHRITSCLEQIPINITLKAFTINSNPIEKPE